MDGHWLWLKSSRGSVLLSQAQDWAAALNDCKLAVKAPHVGWDGREFVYPWNFLRDRNVECWWFQAPLWETGQRTKMFFLLLLLLNMYNVQGRSGGSWNWSVCTVKYPLTHNCRSGEHQVGRKQNKAYYGFHVSFTCTYSNFFFSIFFLTWLQKRCCRCQVSKSQRWFSILQYRKIITPQAKYPF